MSDRTDGETRVRAAPRTGPDEPRPVDTVPLSLYVHIPFCHTKCPYCDFNTYAGIEGQVPTYVEALCGEILAWGGALDRPRAITVFFGGGTPSYLPESRIAAITAAIRRAFRVDPSAEVTLEANPDDLTASKLHAYLDMGVDRLSMGVQSLDDRLLSVLGRRHSAGAAVDAFRMALQAGFDNVSIDLMYGLPHQSLEDWRSTLDEMLDLGPKHVSLYGLTLEGGTPMERWVQSGELPGPDPDLAADMYLAAEDSMGALGYRHYEISNWARPGYESRHNMTYWRNRPYLGVGPGAHSYLADLRFTNVRSPREYARRLAARPRRPVERGGVAGRIGAMPAVDTVEPIDRRLEMAETMMLGLRLDTGIAAQEFIGRFGRSPADVYGPQLAELTASRLLETVDGRVRLTGRGRLLGNEVFARFFV